MRQDGKNMEKVVRRFFQFILEIQLRARVCAQLKLHLIPVNFYLGLRDKESFGLDG